MVIIMIFGGLQKLTLLDFPGHVACTVFTKGCNLRCPFCHNAGLVLPEENQPPVTEEELFSFLEKRRGVMEGVAVTGGEPLLQPWMPDFLRRVREMGFMTKLDTNGTFPERLRAVLAEGLCDYVAMDIKNSPEHYGATVGFPGSFDLSPILESMEILKSGNTSFEFRTTAVKGLHKPEYFESIGRWIGPVEHYFIQNFKDSGDLLTPGHGPLTEEELDEALAIVQKYIPKAEVRGR